MTALEKYVRLEAEALWRDGPGAEPRSVIVSFGRESLVITDISDAPLTHWSLAATRIVDEQNGAVIYSPDNGLQETLRVSDPFLVEAIREVTASARRQARPRWRLAPVLLLVLAMVLTGLLVWVPGQVRGWVRGLVSEPQTVEISNELLDRLAIARCREPRAAQAFDALAAQVLDPGEEVWIADLPQPGIALLPDGRAILDVGLLEKAGSPEAFAGWLALAANLPDDRDALDWQIDMAELDRVLGFAFTGKLSEDELDAMAERTLSETAIPTPRSVEAALGRLRSAGIAVGPLRDSLNLPPETESGPFVRPLTGQDWAALLRICDR